MKKIIVIIFISMLIYACGYREGIIQKADKSFLMFNGSLKNVSVQIDDAKPFILERTSSNKKSYQISPGKHTLKVYRNGELLINRVLFLENQATMEVQIPWKKFILS